MRLLNQLAKPVDNSPLIFFRWAFGFLIACESLGAILTGWVKKAMVDPQFNFTFIGFEWLQPLPGNGMYYYYGIMAVLGVLIMLGFYYRWSLSLFALMWWGVYLMQKSHYNNHYYLLVLFCLLMLIVPAHANGSWDARRNPQIRTNYCGQWCIRIFQLMLWIVYTYAALAKLYPGWWEGHFISAAFAPKHNWPIIGSLLQLGWVQKLVMVGGIIYDLTVIPLLLYPKTRKWAVAASFVFHLFNSVVFGIGIFPYLMLACLVFFVPVDHLGRKWLVQVPDEQPVAQPMPKILWYSLLIFFTIQLLLPLRHHLFQGDVLITEEGHRMSWRMMLRTKSGFVRFKVIDQDSGASSLIHPNEYLTPKQTARLATHPDMIWQFSRYLENELRKKGQHNLEIYAIGQISINGGPMREMIDPQVDLLTVDWWRFRHKPWILIN